MEKVTKDMIVGEVLEKNNDTAKFFLEIGMHCLGCPSARSETIEQACATHDADSDALITKINEYIENN